MRRFNTRTSGFLLFEAMLAVVIFALGSLMLAKSVENLNRAERFRREDSLARRLLANRMTEILSGKVPLSEKSTETFKEGPWTGMQLDMLKEPLELKNEKEQELFGLYTVTLVLKWKSRDDVITRDMSFIIYPRQR